MEHEHERQLALLVAKLARVTRDYVLKDSVLASREFTIIANDATKLADKMLAHPTKHK